MTELNLPTLKIDIRKNNFDISLETKSLINQDYGIGAVVSFLGIVRDLSKNNDLKFMEIEHYPGMSEKILQIHCKKALELWDIEGISLIHRVGKFTAGDNIVLLLVATAHRTEAFNAAEFIMDFLKSEAPFWKKETTSTGAVWIEQNESDKKKILRWK